MKRFSLFILFVLLFILILSFYKISNTNIVNGKKHIYKGQFLSKQYIANLHLYQLSKRASWLTSEQFLDSIAKIAVENLIEDAENDGICLTVISSYRFEKRQQELFDSASKDKKYQIALPGQSEHQTGLAIDFAACPMLNGKRNDFILRNDLKKAFNLLPEYKWLNSFCSGSDIA
jgi:LAS superfamily LD-carboxypeptidase LdcB